MAWGILIVIVLGVVSTLLFLTMFLSDYKQAHECDSYKSIMCYVDWKCYYGTNDAFGNPVGDLSGSYPGQSEYSTSNPGGKEGSLGMECYLRGLYGDTSNDDCAAFYAHRDPQACNADGLNNNFCKNYNAATQDDATAGSYDATAGTNGQNAEVTSEGNPFGCMCMAGLNSNNGYALPPPNNGNNGMPTCSPGDLNCTAGDGSTVTGTPPSSTFCYQSAAFISKAYDATAQAFCVQPAAT